MPKLAKLTYSGVDRCFRVSAKFYLQLVVTQSQLTHRFSVVIVGRGLYIVFNFGLIHAAYSYFVSCA